MNVQLRFKSLRKMDDLEKYVEKKVGSVGKKYRMDHQTAEIDLMKIGNEYVSRCRLIGCSAPIVSAAEFDIFACVDSVAEKINKVLRREKDRRIKQQKKNKTHRHYHNGFDEDESQEFCV